MTSHTGCPYWLKETILEQSIYELQKYRCTRQISRPAPASSEIKTRFDLKEYGESIRNQTLDEIKDALWKVTTKEKGVDEYVHWHKIEMTIESLRAQSTKEQHE
jgi:hypothetical protein